MASPSPVPSSEPSPWLSPSAHRAPSPPRRREDDDGTKALVYGLGGTRMTLRQLQSRWPDDGAARICNSKKCGDMFV